MTAFRRIAIRLAGIASAALSVSAGAATGLVDFEAAPPLATGPSIYVAVPGPQTIVTPEATFTGGVVLGFATFFPAIAFASPPNVYGTADFGNRLSETLTVTMSPAFATTEVSFALFNGEVFTQSYRIDAFNGSSLVASQTLADVVPNFNAGYGLVDLIAAGGMTSVTVTPVGAPASWDFLLDTVAFNQSITSVVHAPPPPVPQPAVAPTRGHRHGRGEGETELLEVNFGDDQNDIRGSVVLVTPSVPVVPVVPVTPVPEPSTSALLLLGLTAMGRLARRRRIVR